MANMGVGYGGVSRDTRDMKLSQKELELKEARERVALKAKDNPVPVAPPDAAKDAEAGKGITVESSASKSDGIGLTDGKPVELKRRGEVLPPNPEDDKPADPPAELKLDEQQKGDVVYHAKSGDSVSSVVANNYEVVKQDGGTSNFLLNKNGIVEDPEMRKIALAGAEALVAEPENKPVADANKEYAAKNKKHQKYGNGTADFLGDSEKKGQEASSRLVLRETYDVQLADGSKVTLRRRNAPTPEAPKPQAEPKPAELTPEDAKIAREDIPDCRRRQFNGGNVSSCYDGPSSEDPKKGVYRPVIGGNVDRNHTLTTEQAVAREKSTRSEGRASIVKTTVPDAVGKEYVDSRTGKPIDTTSDAGKATLLKLEDGIRQNDKNKTSTFMQGSSFFMPKTLDAYGSQYMLQSDWNAMNIPQDQNVSRWNILSYFSGGKK